MAIRFFYSTDSELSPAVQGPRVLWPFRSSETHVGPLRQSTVSSGLTRSAAVLHLRNTASLKLEPSIFFRILQRHRHRCETVQALGRKTPIKTGTSSPDDKRYPAVASNPSPCVFSAPCHPQRTTLLPSLRSANLQEHAIIVGREKVECCDSDCCAYTNSTTLVKCRHRTA